MSYLVLARKYRPQTFSQVVGQDHVTKTLSNAFVQDRVHHAFLFCGPRGCGKTTTARILAKALNCEKGPTPEPCGTCDACKSITNGSAVDYFEMDGASNRGIDSIRDLTEAVRYQPAALRKKVYVIDEVHMLTTEAFNALLKTLEEPPEHVTFIMATTEPHKVPNTILSRCQRFDFKLVPSPQLIDYMRDILKQEEISIDDGALHLIARESGGSVRDALSLCDQIISYVGNEGIEEKKVAEVLGVADRSLVRTLITALAEGDAKTCLEAVDGAITRGVDEVQIARALVRSLRDLAVAQVAPGAQELLEGSAEERQEISEQAAGLEASRVRQMFDRMLQTCNELGETEQPRLVLDMGLIDVAATEAAVPIGDLIGRLKTMETRLASGIKRSEGGSTGAGGTAQHPSAAPILEVKSDGYDDLAATPDLAVTPTPIEAANPVETSAPPSSAPASPSSPSSAPPSSAPSSAPPSSAAVPVESAIPADVPVESTIPVESAAILVESLLPVESSLAPSTAALSANHGLRAWESVMSGLDKVKEYSLMTVYQTAKVLHWGGGSVRVAFPAGALTTEIAMEKDKVKRMQAFLIEHTGEPLQFHVSVLTGTEGQAVVSVLEDAQKREADDRVARVEEAKNHPMTKLVLRTFGAVIKEIKIDDV